MDVCFWTSITEAPYYFNLLNPFFCSWIDGYGSPPGQTKSLINSSGCLTFSTTDPRDMAAELLPDILRLSVDCPYSDVRERCSSMLTDLRVGKRPAISIYNILEYLCCRHFCRQMMLHYQRPVSNQLSSTLPF